MASFRDLDIVHRLNAPTRAAGARRRRLRKAASALCLVVAALLAFGTRSTPASSSPAAPSEAPTAQDDPAMKGRQLVAVPIDTALTDRVRPGTRVDVWSRTGTRLASEAPATLAKDAGTSLASATSPSPRVLVGLTPSQISSIATSFGAAQGSWNDLFVTLSPSNSTS